MPLEDQVGRWIERAEHIKIMLDQMAATWPSNQRLLPSSLANLQEMLTHSYLEPALADAPEGAVAGIVEPLLTALTEFREITSMSGGSREFVEAITKIRDIAQTTALSLRSDDSLRVQTVDEVISDFAEEYRTSLILALTANYALSQTVTRWRDEKFKGRGVGNHLDLSTMQFVGDPSDRTIPMANLTSASTGEPLVVTPSNFGAAMKEMMSGGTPPPIYRMAYTQWFTTIHAAWEDTYRPRLAAAHGVGPDRKSWEKNDIRSEFFHEVKLIRHDISHKRGICVGSAHNKIINWVVPGEEIAPTPRQMLDLLDVFPDAELRCPPTKTESTTDPLPYQFEREWVARVRAHVERLAPAKKKRAAVVQQVLDDWMGAEH
ncbi:hypothetical protein GFY24_19005 [Nocardia sp. SYP-A9097]|uniref:hypothetical protein n=1 Tax=Nocardia sp. SYP-A9097 TaxID=2663237 RepID=UPI00129AE50D|nr:hypothetical protein [Nocardia sp. SYP-A9097]MRH89509.1 hypothetical protein [Nocardia sp. SYP-A9097]